MTRARAMGAILVRLALLGAVGAACGSCAEEYFARRDTLSPGSGDAVRADAAMQGIDPWPRHASNVDLVSNGERLQHAMESYRNPSTGASTGGSAQFGPTGGGTGVGGTGGATPTR